MVQTSYPLANSPILTPEQWSKMAQNWLNTGVIKGALNELQVYADSTGMRVKVKSGQAWIKGHFYESDAEEILPIATADSTNPRIDRVIVRVDWVANTIQLAILQGVAAVSPVAPALTQNSSRWEISLAQILVNTNTSTITGGNVTDERIGANDNPMFFLDISTIGGINPSELRQVPITSSYVVFKKFFTVGSNEIIATLPGLYDIDIQANWSGLNSDVAAEIIIRRTRSGGTYNDYVYQFRGATGQGGNNGGVETPGIAVFDCNVGDKLQFFARHYDIGVRDINVTRIKCSKISDI